MDWVFRIFTLVAAVGLAAHATFGTVAVISNLLEGKNFLLFPIATIPIGVGFYASWHIIVSCMTDDLSKLDCNAGQKLTLPMDD